MSTTFPASPPWLFNPSSQTAHRMSRFPPKPAVLTTVRMTRVAYAQLVGQKFHPPKIWGHWNEAEGTKEWRWRDIGMKLVRDPVGSCNAAQGGPIRRADLKCCIKKVKTAQTPRVSPPKLLYDRICCGKRQLLTITPGRGAKRCSETRSGICQLYRTAEVWRLLWFRSSRVRYVEVSGKQGCLRLHKL